MVKLLIVIVCLLILIVIVNFKYNTETFITDYYDKYFNDISIPTDFYETSAQFAFPKHYAAEMHDKFFIDALESEKEKIDEKFISNDVEEKVKSELYDRVNKFLVELLNKKLFQVSSDEKYIFSNIFSKITNIYQAIWSKGNCIVVTSEHIIYRDTKVYGASITITTLHNIKDGSIHLIDYKLNGFIFEDRIKNTIYPSNLIEDSYQEFKKDKVTIPDEKYQTAYVCKYLADIKKFRGITVDTQNLGCNS